MRYGDVVQISDATGIALLMVLRPATSLDFGYHPSVLTPAHLSGRYLALILDGSIDYGGIRREAGFVGPISEQDSIPVDPA